MQDPFTVIIYGVVSLALWIVATGIAFTIGIPLVGVLIRYRANYTPKTGAVRLDDEVAPSVAPRADASIGYFGMMKRVHRLEGWEGLYKGIMPSIITSLIADVVVAPFSVVLLQFTGPNSPPLSLLHRWVIGLGMSIIPTLLIFPMQIIVNRAITTPHKLPAFAPRIALRTLLSPAERAQPLRLYLAPGVGFSVVLEALILSSLSMGAQTIFPPPTSWVRETIAWVPTIVLGTLLTTPLEVLTARLTLQRRLGPPSLLNTPSAEILAAAAMDVVPVYSAEPVMEFRPVLTVGADAVGEEGEEPYTGLFDCARKIVAEEGWGVLARAWWLNVALLALTLSARMIPRPPGSPGPFLF
ncbi:hypothetical protein C8R45DRAFT_1017919 [Mycena sanguinolenta]|nr:hypothetical protein C8R45DRAFT_1017919 [Mycena sanguinolenta]